MDLHNVKYCIVIATGGHMWIQPLTLGHAQSSLWISCTLNECQTYWNCSTAVASQRCCREWNIRAQWQPSFVPLVASECSVVCDIVTAFHDENFSVTSFLVTRLLSSFFSSGTTSAVVFTRMYHCLHCHVTKAYSASSNELAAEL